MQSTFTRGFRLHLADGRCLDGAEFPSGRGVIVDDPEYGLATAAVSIEELLKGYHGARVEWPGEQEAEAQSAREAWRVVRPTPDRQRAVDDLARRQERHPDFEFRLVHVTTTYTVEER
jgi:hypothetical protein